MTSSKSQNSGPAGSFTDMHLQEIEQRGWMFFHLKRDKEYASSRIKQNLQWEFEFSPSPELEKKVDEILNRIYKK
jgi:hypothetical protein